MLKHLKRRLDFNLMYFRSPPWDTGVSPPELLAFIASHPPGRALDLGCGTGTNAITLARAGWDVTGVDFAIRAIRSARRKARAAGVHPRFITGDVTRSVALGAMYDLILDIGCYHGLDDAQKADYAAAVKRMLAPGGHALIYVHFRRPGSDRGATDEDLQRFGPQCELQSRIDGTDTTRGRPSAWLTYRRIGLELEGHDSTNQPRS